MSVGNRTQAEKASSRGYTLIDALDPENLVQAWTALREAHPKGRSQFAEPDEGGING